MLKKQDEEFFFLLRANVPCDDSNRRLPKTNSGSSQKDNVVTFKQESLSVRASGIYEYPASVLHANNTRRSLRKKKGMDLRIIKHPKCSTSVHFLYI